METVGFIIIIFLAAVLYGIIFWISLLKQFKYNIFSLFLIIMLSMFPLLPYFEDNKKVGLIVFALVVSSLFLHWIIIRKRRKRFDFIRKNYPRAINKRVGYLSDFENCSRMKIKAVINSDINALEKEEIEEQERLRKEDIERRRYNEIKDAYPNGLQKWHEVTRIYKKETVFENIDRIKILEKEYHELCWIEDQKNYANESRDFNPSDFGCYCYDIIFNTVTGETQNYRVWQHFYCSFFNNRFGEIEFCDDLKFIEENYSDVSKALFRQIVLTDSVYDKIFNLIMHLRGKFGDITVLWGNSYLRDFHVNPQVCNDYHFKYLRNKLDNVNISHIYIEDIQKLEGITRNIIIVEIATNNDMLKAYCEVLLDFLSNIRPLITYISLWKEIDKEEAIKRIDIRKKETEDRRELINLLKNPFRELYIPSQSTLPCFSLYNYYPTTCDFNATHDEWEIRNLIWDFKANPNTSISAQVILELHKKAEESVLPQMISVLKYFFNDKLSYLTLICIPSSKQITNEIRYRNFSSKLCQETGMENGFEYIRVLTDGSESHLGKVSKAKILIDEQSVKNKIIILFDDVITSGKSMENFSNRLTKLGAVVIAGFSIGRTKHEREHINPIEFLKLNNMSINEN